MALTEMEKLIEESAGLVREIQVNAIEDFQAYFDAEYYGQELSQFIEQYADKLRQQSKEPNS